MKRLNKNNLTFILKKYNKEGKEIYHVRTKKLGRFSKVIGSLRTSRGYFDVYLRVVYGKTKDFFGKESVFDNEGQYNNYKDLLLAYNAFKEETLEDDKSELQPK